MTDNELDVPVFTRATLDTMPDGPDLPSSGALLLIDKPSDWTSFDVVAKARRLLNIRKIGHAGTLDPMATGLLVLCLGRATKLADTVQAGIKEYAGSMRFGATTPTDDAESEESAHYPVEHLTEEIIRQSALSFLGESMQRPPMYSARKIKGERLYRIARRGEEVEVPPRPVTLFEFDITQIALPEVFFRIVCSKGTYIRAIARDMGANVGSGAYLTSLRRTRSGHFHVSDAVTIDQLTDLRAGRAGRSSS